MFFYAVAKGKNTGIYTNWLECKKQIDGFKNPKFRKFSTQKEAEDFIKNNTTIQTKMDAFLTSSTDPMETEHNLIAFTDGACSSNGKKGAKASFAVVWPYHPDMNYANALNKDELQTNNRGEFSALIYALCQADILDPVKEKTLIVYTDSKLLISSMTEWLSNWKRNNWKRSDGQIVSNLDLIKTLDSLMQERKTVLKYVPAHTGTDTWETKHNDMADKLAKQALSE